MFFSTYVLTKKGPLAKIWLAAHWDKKLTQKDVRVVDLNDTVLHIVEPAVPIALRTSGELMLGVVRIYALKVSQLLKDATEVTITLKARNAQIVKHSVTKDGKELGAGITMDLVVGRVGAEQLCEADFNDIADILAPSKGGKRGPLAEAEVIGSAWVPVENSQLDELAMLGNEADIAKIRQDLLANFGAARDSTSSSKKSSLSSAEHARAANDNAVAQLDIGMPVPDEFGGPLAVDAVDPFALPNDMYNDGGVAEIPPAALDETAAPAGEPFARPQRKMKAMQLMDAADTIIPPATLQKHLEDRHDIVCAERRHGAYDDRDAEDRHLLRLENPLAHCAPTLPLRNATLRAVFEKALRDSYKGSLEALERGRHAAAGDDATAAPAPPAADPLDLPFDQPLPPEFEYQADVPAIPELEEPSRKTKRGRDATDQERLSGRTLETLERVKKMLGNKPGASCKLSAVIRGEDRVVAARMFVDVLALASHNYVALTQAAPYADLVLSGGPKLLSASA